MTYTKQTWINGATDYPLSATRLNYIEQGIEDAHTLADTAISYSDLSYQSVEATGGTSTTTYADYTGSLYRVHTFATNGVFSVTNEGPISVLVVGGGGGGGQDVGGGGGAGGFVYQPAFNVVATSYTVTVGAGGAGGTGSGVRGVSGGNSSFSTLTAIGGGGGGSWPSAGGLDGGSGGGGVGYGGGFADPGNGTDGQGYRGGAVDISNSSNIMSGSAGGGAGGPGSPSVYNDNSAASFVAGGAGRHCEINGTEKLYSVGGAGAANQGFSPSAKTANTGYGGDGSSSAPGGAGASGVVIMRYRIVV